MADATPIALNLSRHTREMHLEIVRGMLEETLALVRDMLATEPAYGGVSRRFDECRSAWSNGAKPTDLVDITTACLKAGRDVVGEKLATQGERAQEMATLVSAMREVVGSVGTQVHTLQNELDQSVNRFEAIGKINDAGHMRNSLLDEVATLKDLTVNNRKAWEEASNGFKQRIATLESQLSATEAEASSDPLTGAGNRRLWERTCTQWMRSPRVAFMLAMFDVDNFKQLNDAHGHDAGDRILQLVARTLAKSLREGDIVARIGGDEFGVLAKNLPLPLGERRMRDIMTKITEGAMKDEGGLAFAPTLSCGIAEYSAGDSFATLSKRADDALYAAKRLGKNRVVAMTRPFIRDLMKR